MDSARSFFSVSLSSSCFSLSIIGQGFYRQGFGRLGYRLCGAREISRAEFFQEDFAGKRFRKDHGSLRPFTGTVVGAQGLSLSGINKP